MSRPIVGIVSNSHLINDRYLIHGAGAINIEALARVSGVLPGQVSRNIRSDSCPWFTRRASLSPTLAQLSHTSTNKHTCQTTSP